MFNMEVMHMLLPNQNNLPSDGQFPIFTQLK